MTHDPFGRPTDTDPPIVLTPEEARVRMAEVKAEEALSVDDLQAQIDAERAEAINEAGEVDEVDQDDLEAKLDEPPEDDDAGQR